MLRNTEQSISLARGISSEQSACNHSPRFRRSNRRCTNIASFECNRGFTNPWRASLLRMVWVHLQVSKEERLTAWLLAAAVRFHGHENRFNLIELLRVVEFQDPPLFGNVVFIKYTQVQSLCLVGPALTPSLKRACVLETWVAVEVIGIENQRFRFCVENASISLLRCCVFRNIKHFGYIEVPRSHQFPNVSIMGEKFLLLVDGRITVSKQLRELPDLSLQCLGPRIVPRPQDFQ